MRSSIVTIHSTVDQQHREEPHCHDTLYSRPAMQGRAPCIILSFRKRKENYSPKKSTKLKKIKKRWLNPPPEDNIDGWAGMCKWQVTSGIDFWDSISSQSSANPATEGSHSLKEKRELNTAKPSSLKIHCTLFLFCFVFYSGRKDIRVWFSSICQLQKKCKSLHG